MKLDEDFILIREYLYDNDGAGAEEVSEATGVSRKTIIYLLKEERLLVGDKKGRSILRCETCRKPINTGRICTNCKEEVQQAIQENISAVKAPRPVKAEEPEEEKPLKGVAKLQIK